MNAIIRYHHFTRGLDDIFIRTRSHLAVFAAPPCKVSNTGTTPEVKWIVWVVDNFHNNQRLRARRGLPHQPAAGEFQCCERACRVLMAVAGRHDFLLRNLRQEHRMPHSLAHVRRIF